MLIFIKLIPRVDDTVFFADGLKIERNNEKKYE